MKSAYISVNSVEAQPTGALVHAFGGRYYRVSHVDRLPTFFMNVVSSSDLWLFLGSNGGLTAGRVDAEQSLFSYQTVDRIYDGAGINGPVTAFWVETAAGEILWEPFARRTAAQAALIRHLYKSVEGDRVWFEEINPDLGLVFRYGWSTSEQHGFVRQCELENQTGQVRKIRVLDGLRNLLPAGIPLVLQSSSSCLADAYKTAELIPGTSLAVYSMAAAIVDRAIPLESLRATVVCSEGLPRATTLLSDRQLGSFFEGRVPMPESQCRGIRSSYFLATSLALAAQETQRWLMVADIGLSQAEVTVRRQALVAGDFGATVFAATGESTRRLRQWVGMADGLQAGAEETTTAHHFANVLFNIMRGGIFQNGHEIPGRDFISFVRQRNKVAADRFAVLLAGLPESMSRADLLARLTTAGDRDLERLGYEYLPLTFSRRHGDPSRPWNRFSIRLRDAQGNRLLTHEGNWRDIFQNWEALGLSHPEFFESFVTRFINASTRDGYNPYRITHAGIDWEIQDLEDPWSSIGYWGDHQVIYLLKLLEWSGRFHPGRLEDWLRQELFSYANVPYRIAGYAAMQRDPRVTIEFDAAEGRAIAELEANLGTDARLVQRPEGGVLHVNLTEKLLVLVLTRLTNFVPGGGVWMNTQRPEWNDANNALVGFGVSVVTLGYLRRMLVHFQSELLPPLGTTAVPVSRAVVELLRSVQSVLATHRSLLSSPAIAPPARRALLDALAAAGSDYRAAIYQRGLGTPTDLFPHEIRQLLETALAYVDHTLRSNRRNDGLFHSYNLLEFSEAPAALQLHRLAPMLEGQVALLSSGLLTPTEVVDLLTALRRSPLYRADQHSYLLYPDRQLPGFLERNVIPPGAVAANPLLCALEASDDCRVIVRDADKRHRFASDLANATALDQRLAALAAEPAWTTLVDQHAAQVFALYESVFHHRAFTGRSGTMFGYEGLGCIYWHMVTKLLLAVQENLFAAEAASDPQAAPLAALYHDIRAGLGFNKTPAVYGAFPTDPYSHTPGHSGAQQPGMTGQVKEEILTRLGELGVKIAHGCVSFVPTLLEAGEFLSVPGRLPYITGGQETSLEMPAGSLGFTFCSIPVVYRLNHGPASIRIHNPDGRTAETLGRRLSPEASARLFARDGSIHHLEICLGSDFRAFSPLPGGIERSHLGTVVGPSSNG